MRSPHMLHGTPLKHVIEEKVLKYAADLRGLCLIHDNADSHKCRLVQDYLETETVV